MIDVVNMLDNLRARVTGSELPCVVISGVTGKEPVETIVESLAEQAREQGLNILVGELDISRDGRVLRPHRHDTSLTTAVYNCGGKPFSEAWSEWSLQAGTFDLILIAAPPLLRSVETALLAKAAAGLVLVVHPHNTHRSDLAKAYDKADTTGCEILGLVMDGIRKEPPRWLKLITGS